MCAQSTKKRNEEKAKRDIKQVTVSPFRSLQVTMKIDDWKRGKENLLMLLMLS